MNINPLLDFISKYESGGDYSRVWGGIQRRHYPPKPLTQMTVDEVLAWQDSIDRLYMSEAAGRYQVMEDTLRPLRGKLVSGDALFDEGTQDSIAIALLRRRGLGEYLAGKLSAEMFANRIAMEWAGMPLVTDYKGRKRGRSYYGGDGLNSAHAKPDDFLRVVKAVKGHEPHPRPDVEPVEPTSPATSPRLVGAIVALFAAAGVWLSGAWEWITGLF